jgi:hypothetical protein
MLIVTSLLKPDAAALLPWQHHVRRPTPTTTLTPGQYRWRRRPLCDGSVARIALVSSLSAGHPFNELPQSDTWSAIQRGLLRALRLLWKRAIFSLMKKVMWTGFHPVCYTNGQNL